MTPAYLVEMEGKVP